jgi:hypothetical protein
MGQTWLNRKIKGPSAHGDEGDPPKKKTVKPYQSIDMDDFNKRTQMHNDSNSAHVAVQNISNTIQDQSGGKWDSTDFNNRKIYAVRHKKPAPRELLGQDVPNTLGGIVSSFFESPPPEKPKPSRKGSYKAYSDIKGVSKDIDELERTDKTLGLSDLSSITDKIRKPTETRNEFRFDNSLSAFVTGNHDESVISYALPIRPKAIQPILPPITKKEATITKSQVKKKERPVDKISMMPIGKLKSNYNTPEKLKESQNTKMLKQTVMSTSGKRMSAYDYQQKRGLSDAQMNKTFPGLKQTK